MRGDHLGAENLMVIRTADGRIKVPWSPDERDHVDAQRLDFTVWTTFWGGMLPTDVVML